MTDKMKLDALVNALRSGEQADMDGCMVRVSRQACEEAANTITDLRQQIAAAEAATLERAAAWHDGERDRIISELSDPRFDGKESLYLDAAADHETCADDIRAMITTDAAAALEAVKADARDHHNV